LNREGWKGGKFLVYRVKKWLTREKRGTFKCKLEIRESEDEDKPTSLFLGGIDFTGDIQVVEGVPEKGYFKEREDRRWPRF